MKIINLNRVRKARAREDARAKADENAARFGRSKAQKSAESAQRQRDETHLDQHKRDQDHE